VSAAVGAAAADDARAAAAAAAAAALSAAAAHPAAAAAAAEDAKWRGVARWAQRDSALAAAAAPPHSPGRSRCGCAWQRPLAFENGRCTCARLRRTDVAH
jgi:hypothetical protein